MTREGDLVGQNLHRREFEDEHPAGLAENEGRMATYLFIYTHRMVIKEWLSR